VAIRSLFQIPIYRAVMVEKNRELSDDIRDELSAGTARQFIFLSGGDEIFTKWIAIF